MFASPASRGIDETKPNTVVDQILDDLSAATSSARAPVGGRPWTFTILGAVAKYDHGSRVEALYLAASLPPRRRRA